MHPQERLAVIQRCVVREMARLGQVFRPDGEVVRGPGTTAVAVREHPGDDGAGHVDLGFALHLGRADAPVVWDCAAGLGKTEEEKLANAVKMWATTTAPVLVEVAGGAGSAPTARPCPDSRAGTRCRGRPRCSASATSTWRAGSPSTGCCRRWRPRCAPG